MKKKLSELLKQWRADSPDEWTMDDFIREAVKLEKELENAKEDLRDSFAAKAMQGELATQGAETGYYEDLSLLAKRSYDIADAMLAERNKGREEE